MDILSNYRISAVIATDRDLAVNAERARIATERSPQSERRTRRAPATAATGSIVCIPSTSH